MKTSVIRAYVLLSVSIIALGLYIFRQTYIRGDTKYFYIKQSFEEPYGLKYNKYRDRLGILQLPEDWFTYDTSEKPGMFFRIRRKQEHFWLNQVWRPVEPKSTGHYEKEIRRTTKGLVYEVDRFKKVYKDSLEYIFEIKYNYLYTPKVEATLIKNYYERGVYKVLRDSVSLISLDSIKRWIE